MEQKYELYHHGILGMKWGVRRFQNEDGSYTKRGLERYRKSEKEYNKIKSDYEQGKASRSDVRTAKKALSKNYDYLKKDYRADKGKKAYQEGRTIGSNRVKAYLGTSAVGFVGMAAAKGLAKYALENTADWRKFTIANTASWAVLGAAALGQGAIIAKTISDNKNLRAYYTHSTPKDDKKK